jgi:hypothetical protein
MKGSPMIPVSFTNGKYSAVINGKTVTRANKAHMDYVIKKAMGSTTANFTSAPQLFEPVKSEFSVIERFEFIRQFVRLLAKGSINSFVLTGSGGIGKTTAVMKTLQSIGLQEDLPGENGDYMVIRGFSTPRALYDILYQFKDKILILDDADAIFKDPIGSNLIKAALDDKPVRVLNWSTSRESDSETPTRFVYTGKMIFISNLSINQFPQAIISRSQKVDVSLDNEEKLEIIAEVFKDIDHAENEKQDVLEFVRENAETAKDLNIRSVVSLLTLRQEFGAKWARIAKYSFC